MGWGVGFENSKLCMLLRIFKSIVLKQLQASPLRKKPMQVPLHLRLLRRLLRRLLSRLLRRLQVALAGPALLISQPVSINPQHAMALAAGDEPGARCGKPWGEGVPEARAIGRPGLRGTKRKAWSAKSSLTESRLVVCSKQHAG